MNALAKISLSLVLCPTDTLPQNRRLAMQIVLDIPDRLGAQLQQFGDRILNPSNGLTGYAL
jgi:hypothetical protein